MLSRVTPFLALSAALLAGCATTNRVALPVAAEPEIGRVGGHVLVPNPEIVARIPGSNVAGASIAACSAVPGGFLVGAIIGAASSGVDSAIENGQTKKAEELVTPIRNTLVGLDTPAEFTAAIRTALGVTPHCDAELIVLDRQDIPKKDVLTAWLEKAPRKTMLLVRCDYYFTPDFGRLVVEAQADLITADDKLRGQATRRFLPFPSLYHNFFSTGRSLADAKPDKEANAAAWQAKGEALRAELAAAVREIAAMFAYDIGQGSAVTEGAAFDERASIPLMGGAMAQGGMMQVKARQERQVDGRRWLRTKTGELLSVE